MHKRRLFNVILCTAGLLVLLGAAVRDADAQSAVITGEVVVTGVAQATEAKKLTFAVGHVDAAQLQQAPAVSALGSLEGKVAGVRLLTGSGGPGGEPNIRLRSATALTSPAACNSPPCGSTDVPGPLIIVDGTITRHGLADINSQDIH